MNIFTFEWVTSIARLFDGVICNPKLNVHTKEDTLLWDVVSRVQFDGDIKAVRMDKLHFQLPS